MKSFLLLTLFLSSASALTTFSSDRRSLSLSQNSQSRRLQNTAIFSTPEEDEKSDPVDIPAAVSTPVEEEEENKYPIDLPSPILLSTSMILGIAGTGSGFELAGGNPSLGFGTTAAIAALSIPLSLFLFYASILKATAETEADDAEYMKGKY